MSNPGRVIAGIPRAGLEEEARITDRTIASRGSTARVITMMIIPWEVGLDRTASMEEAIIIVMGARVIADMADDPMKDRPTVLTGAIIPM